MRRSDTLFLFEYNYWANHKVLAEAAKVPHEQYRAAGSFPYGGLRGTLVHILEAEWAWRLRFQGLGFGDELLPDVFPTVESLIGRWQDEEKAMRRFLESRSDADLQTVVRYPTASGHTRERVLWQALVHVVNHGTQHRAEAAALLTDFGHSPGDLDVTVFLDHVGRR